MPITNYPIHRGINRPLMFKGLCAQYVLYAFALVGVDFLLFIILFIGGLNSWICVAVALGAGFGGLFCLYRTSIRYGVNGLMKKRAQRRLPQGIVFNSRDFFLALSPYLQIDEKK